MNDIVLVDKPAGWTSFDVVAKIRGAIRASYAAKGVKPTKRQLKVGHAGTLDPFATGLLVILLGDACSRSNEFLKLDKVYDAAIRLGATSSTGDPDGELTTVSDRVPLATEINETLARFTGEITQTPPVYSAIKIGGERAYKLARKGKEVAMPSRQVTVYSLELLDYTYPDIQIRAHVSSGTYIRSLAEDIGATLGVGAYCSELRRISTSTWSIDNAQAIEQVLAGIQRDNDNTESNNE
jgi:tRNA pseudouridine55 synthase